MCEINARAIALSAATARPDVLIRPGLISVTGLDGRSLRRKAKPMFAKLTENQTALLQNAASREDRGFVLPPNLEGGAGRSRRS
jgi:hypothetical protein